MTRRLFPFLALPALLASTSPPPAARSHAGDSPPEPAFDPARARMLFSENFDNYSFEKLHPKCGGPEPKNTVIDHSFGYCKQFAPGYDAGVQVVPGHSGNGVAFHYDGTYQEAHGVVLTDGSVTPTGKSATVVQYWAKYTADDPAALTTTDAKGIGSAIVQIKNIMLWHNGSDGRFQIDLHSHQGGCPVYGPSYTMLEVIDQVDAGCNSSQPVGPFFKNFADGQWHRWTILYKPNTSRGSRDGIARLWIDGTLVIRIESGACGVTPPGGWKPWCDVSELDNLYSGNYGVGFLEWGANRTDQSGIKFTYAIDDVKWWVMK
jgi:hypothetical protein